MVEMFEIDLDKIEKIDTSLPKGYHKSKTSRLVHLNIWIPREWKEMIDCMLAKGKFVNKSEAIRYMIRYYLDLFF